jgi:hypothetical protein
LLLVSLLPLLLLLLLLLLVVSTGAEDFVSEMLVIVFPNDSFIMLSTALLSMTIGLVGMDIDGAFFVPRF